jgi:hypothetical protein
MRDAWCVVLMRDACSDKGSGSESGPVWMRGHLPGPSRTFQDLPGPSRTFHHLLYTYRACVVRGARQWCEFLPVQKSEAWVAEVYSDLLGFTRIYSELVGIARSGRLARLCGNGRRRTLQVVVFLGRVSAELKLRSPQEGSGMLWSVNKVKCRRPQAGKAIG